MLTRLVNLSILGVMLLVVACQQPASNVSPPVSGLNGSLQVWLEVPAEAKAGELVPLKLHLKNVTDHTLNIGGGGLPYDFIVVTPEGSDVFQYAIPKAEIVAPIVIQPGVTKDYQVGWSQRYKRYSYIDESGTLTVFGIVSEGDPLTLSDYLELGPVPPGDYFVRGSLEVSLSDRPDMERVVTDPLPLKINPVPNPTYPAQSVQISDGASDPS